MVNKLKCKECKCFDTQKKYCKAYDVPCKAEDMYSECVRYNPK